MNISELLIIIEGNTEQLHRICDTCKTMQLIGDRCTVCFEWVN